MLSGGTKAAEASAAKAAATRTTWLVRKDVMRLVVGCSSVAARVGWLLLPLGRGADAGAFAARSSEPAAVSFDLRLR